MGIILRGMNKAFNTRESTLSFESNNGIPLINTDRNKIIYGTPVYSNRIFEYMVVMLNLNAVSCVYPHTADLLPI